MTSTLNIFGKAVRDILSTAFWVGGQAIHHGTNGYQAARRFYISRIASGELQRDVFAIIDEAQAGLDLVVEKCDRALDEWQILSDAFRGLLGAILLFIWVTCLHPLAILAARTAGAVVGVYRGLTGERALALIGAAEATVCSALPCLIARFVARCDQALSFVFCLEADYAKAVNS